MSRRSKRKQTEELVKATVRPDEDIALVFAPWGPVAELLGDGYSPRRGQALMARLVKRALEEDRHALIEAGTGSGKSFAYLIPLIWTGKQDAPEPALGKRPTGPGTHCPPTLHGSVAQRAEELCLPRQAEGNEPAVDTTRSGALAW